MRSTNEVHNSIGNDNYIKSLLEFMHDQAVRRIAEPM